MLRSSNIFSALTHLEGGSKQLSQNIHLTLWQLVTIELTYLQHKQLMLMHFLCFELHFQTKKKKKTETPQWNFLALSTQPVLISQVSQPVVTFSSQQPILLWPVCKTCRLILCPHVCNTVFNIPGYMQWNNNNMLVNLIRLLIQFYWKIITPKQTQA